MLKLTLMLNGNGSSSVHALLIFRHASMLVLYIEESYTKVQIFCPSEYYSCDQSHIVTEAEFLKENVFLFIHTYRSFSRPQ